LLLRAAAFAAGAALAGVLAEGTPKEGTTGKGKLIQLLPLPVPLGTNDARIQKVASLNPTLRDYILLITILVASRGVAA